MRKLLTSLLLLALPAVAGAGVFPRTITFDTSEESPETRLILSELAADFPTDWSSHEALVLEMRASSSQRMNLKVYTGEDPASGEPSYSRVRVHLYPKVWIRAAIPVSLLAEPPKTGHDMAAVGNRSRPGYFLSLGGPFVPLTGVTALAFEMQGPVGSPTLEIRSV